MNKKIDEKIDFESENFRVKINIRASKSFVSKLVDKLHEIDDELEEDKNE